MAGLVAEVGRNRNPRPPCLQLAAAQESRQADQLDRAAGAAVGDQPAHRGRPGRGRGRAAGRGQGRGRVRPGSPPALRRKLNAARPGSRPRCGRRASAGSGCLWAVIQTSSRAAPARRPRRCATVQQASPTPRPGRRRSRRDGGRRASRPASVGRRPTWAPPRMACGGVSSMCEGQASTSRSAPGAGSRRHARRRR